MLPTPYPPNPSIYYHTMNATSTVGWANEPQGRGTLGLIWSCLATIFLCTWNAVHPNLPAESDSAWRIFRCRARYMLVALAAPEVMCLLAIEQLLDAKAVQNKVGSLPALTQ